MSARMIVVACTLISVALLAAGLAWRERSAVAVWLAPDKQPSTVMSAQATNANAKFWDALHGGRYEDLPDVIEALTAAYLEDPRDAETAAHIGFSHVWRLSERARLARLPANRRPRRGA